jgi:uncharacterized protein (DUF952 family)
MSIQQMANKVIYKVLSRDLWAAAETAGQFEGAGIDLADGYIHFSTGEQLVETVEKHFAGQTDLVLVAVDADALSETVGDALKWEASRGGALFPHLYTTLPVSAAQAVHDLPIGDDGKHVLPNGLI